MLYLKFSIPKSMHFMKLNFPKIMHYMKLYIPKSILHKLSSLYYLCLFKLFKLNFTSDSIETNQFLKKYNLYLLQHRIFVLFARFSTRIYFDDNATLSLKTQLRARVHESVNPVAI